MAQRLDQGLSPRLGTGLFERLAQRNDQLFWGGVAMALVGVLALLFPVVATVAVAVMVGWILIFAGAATIYSAFSVEGTGPFFGELLIGLLKLALGVYLVRHPDVGMVALTLLLAAVFIIDGAVQVALSLELRPQKGWVWMLIAGLIAIGVGLLVAAELPDTSLVTIGILLGVSFLSTGIARISLSRRLSALARNR
jgi:uncharacterized membrane protein HdeD (DUF308 family)